MGQSSTGNLSAVGESAKKSPTGNPTLESVKNTIADKLHTAAGIIEKRVEQNQENPVADYANRASSWLDDAADYIRDFEPQKAKADLQRQVRSNPGRSLMVAAGAGLVLGILFRRR